VVASAVEQGAQGVVVVGAAPEAVPAAACLRGTFDLPPRSEPMIRGAGCGHPARPDLWEAGESDLPGPPDTPLQVAFEWHVAEPVVPTSVVQTPYGQIEVPMLVEHHLTGTATVAEQQVFVVGSLPGRAADRVQLLCVAVGFDPPGR